MLEDAGEALVRADGPGARAPPAGRRHAGARDRPRARRRRVGGARARVLPHLTPAASSRAGLTRSRAARGARASSSRRRTASRLACRRSRSRDTPAARAAARGRGTPPAPPTTTAAPSCRRRPRPVERGGETSRDRGLRRSVSASSVRDHGPPRSLAVWTPVRRAVQRRGVDGSARVGGGRAGRPVGPTTPRVSIEERFCGTRSTEPRAKSPARRGPRRSRAECRGPRPRRRYASPEQNRDVLLVEQPTRAEPRSRLLAPGPLRCPGVHEGEPR